MTAYMWILFEQKEGDLVSVIIFLFSFEQGEKQKKTHSKK